MSQHRSPPFVSSGDRQLTEYSEPVDVVRTLQSLYKASCQILDEAVTAFSQDPEKTFHPHAATYPLIRCHITQEQMSEKHARLSFGVVDQPGVYETTVTDPFLFESYLTEQLTLLVKHYGATFFVGESNQPIPLTFALERLPCSLSNDPDVLSLLRQNFEHPNLQRVDDSTVNHTRALETEESLPLSLFTAERVDYSLHRLKHYTGTSSGAFQNFILLTNYQRYIKEFIAYGLEEIRQKRALRFTFSGGQSITYDTIDKAIEIVTDKAPLVQMPAYHLEFPDRNGISIVNVGVGPSNAKTLTDHLAVLRPHCWLMLGHCAGLRSTQQLGDYVLAHGYVREDSVLDDDLPYWVPIPAIAEIQVALQEAVAEITSLRGSELKKRMRTGTVFTTDNRNWELRARELYERFNQSRAIAVDMESATIAGNGLRFRVPYGTLLCVSDRPIHGEIKLPGMANQFYEQSISQHLTIGLKTIEIIRERGINALHSRKLRGFNEPPFR
tara:strand:+ start:114 stop:1607 length:1494 start_codon:yes stop_codon:yes gene_type:complete